MSKQRTVNCPTCKGKAGTYTESTRQAVDHTGKPVTVYGTTWNPCTGPCGGSGQVVGGHS